jgi:hypothetical protein
MLIRFFASMAVALGLVMLGIDLGEGMPTWWTCVEGPSFGATGALVLIALACSDQPSDGDGVSSRRP